MNSLHLKKMLFPLYGACYVKPKNIVRNRREYLGSKGLLRPAVDTLSVLLFTTHKCASMYFGRLLNAIDQQTSFQHLDFDSYFAGQLVPVVEGFDDQRFLNRAFQSRGFVYGPMRSNRSIPNKNKYKILLVLRDPRDVMVSLYYSMRYSHSLISRQMIDIRLEAMQHSVDSYALFRAREFRQKYDDYRELLDSPFNTLFVKYEDLIADPRSNVQSIVAFMGADLDENLKEKLITDLMPTNDENVESHRRSGKSGQFREKLQPETVEELGKEFKDTLKCFGFQE